MTLGMFAKDMLGDERFQTLCTLFGQQCATDILNTAPHEAKKREGIHAAYTGFTDFTGLMSKFAEAYSTLLQQQDIDRDPEV